MDYKIVKQKSITQLEIQVNNLLEYGWKPHGGAFTVTKQDSGILFVDEYCQALIKQ